MLSSAVKCCLVLSDAVERCFVLSGAVASRYLRTYDMMMHGAVHAEALSGHLRVVWSGIVCCFFVLVGIF